MIAAAEHQFKMDRCGEDGVSLGEKLAHVEQTTGRRPPELDGPAVPFQLAHLLDWFRELNTGRTGNGFGANPLSWGEIDAWIRLTGRTVRDWEIGLLRALDQKYMAVMGSK